MSTTEVAVSQAENETKAQIVESHMDEDFVDNKAEALACLMEGKRNMLCKDTPAAVTCLAEACELMSAECGEKAPECGEAYYFYGKALLEMARLENVVLGNALSGVPGDEDIEKGATQVEDPEHMTWEERTEVEEKVNEALVENFENCEKAESPFLTKDVVSGSSNPVVASGGRSWVLWFIAVFKWFISVFNLLAVEKVEVVENIIVDNGSEEVELDEDCDHIDEEKAEAKAEEDPTSLQLAWEVLELSKIICLEQLEAGVETLPSETKAALEKRYCDTLLLLSEVSVESGNYHQAVEDLKICLERQKRLLPADSRNIAETFYHLGVALGFHKNYDEAFMSLDAAVSVLNMRMTNLKEKSGSVAKNEVTEVKALLPEIEAKLIDLKDTKAETDRKTSELYQIGGASSSTSKAVSAIPVKKIDCA